MLARSPARAGKGAYSKLNYASPEVVLTNRGADRVRSGHPWVYRSDIVGADGAPGDIARLTDRKGAFLGFAFYNPRSEITLRVATREDEPVDEDWFASRIERALAYRKSLNVDGDACRLIHAEADGIPGLVADRYSGYIVLQVGSAAVERRLEWVVAAMCDQTRPAGVLLRGDAGSRKREGLETGVRLLRGEVPEQITVREGAVRSGVDPWRGQKTGAFLDQRENRLAAGRYAFGRVLDVFSYTGGFALHAARSADGVEAVDSSEPALEAARQNAALNDLTNLIFTRANAFDLLRERSDAGKRYDAIILDPPAFAKTRRDLSKARRAYKEINLRAMKMLSPGGVLITCSCSYHLSREMFEETLRLAAADAGAAMRAREWRSQAADHPEVLTIPEIRYLKCAVLECP